LVVKDFDSFPCIWTFGIQWAHNSCIFQDKKIP
jgi:hypothetical protein